jgi:hypothetical protein
MFTELPALNVISKVLKYDLFCSKFLRSIVYKFPYCLNITITSLYSKMLLPPQENI